MAYKYNPFTGNLDDAGSGGGGTPGGSTTQLQFNNAGAFGGISTLTYDGSILTTSGRFINSYNAVASSPAKAFTGTWFTGGTGTTTKPHVLIEPTGTTSTAWSTSGTGFGVNAPSGFAGNLLDLQVNGSRQFSVAGSGTVSVGTVAGTTGNIKFANNIQFGTSGAGAIIANAGYSIVRLGNSDNDGNFNRLEFGTNTSSAPALKRSSAILQVRLADDSAYTTIDAQHRLQGTAPTTAADTGTAGDIRYDANYVYICTATNTWKRAALATW